VNLHSRNPISLLLITCCIIHQVQAQTQPLSIPLGGNTFQISPKSREEITDHGIESWKQKTTVFAIYFSLPAAMEIQLVLPLLEQTSNSTLAIAVNGAEKQYHLKAGDQELVIGKTMLQGYNVIKLKGIRKSGSDFARFRELLIRYDGPPIRVNYVPDNQDNNFHFGRRGPSVHLAYAFPKNTTIKWFYNELTVPADHDPIGSFYMANGFGEGYFGMQRNSATERRILFSVWSPFETDDPEAIPEAQRIRLLKKGKDVYTGAFGNEGAGGQSYLVYPWKPGTVYKFLNSVAPDGKGNTIYTAYFMEGNTGQWRLIASFLRPQTDTYYQHAHSFLEIFNPDNGYVSRKLYLNNQWACDTTGHWIPLTEATLTGDINATRRFRVDFDGGLEGDLFFLKNGGFFNANTALKTKYTRVAKGKIPEIDWDALP
jgi:hypothetical protein